MTQRKSKLFPRQVSDVGAFIFVWVMIPATYMYETQLVVPSLYKDDYTSLILHNIFGLFLLFNLLGNFIGKYTEKSLLKKKIVKAVHIRTPYHFGEFFSHSKICL